MKVQLPWFGKATGSSAGMIYQSYWGHTYARTFPASFHYPNTPAQQACQARYWHNRFEANVCYGTIEEQLSDYQKRIVNPYNQMQKSVIGMMTEFEENPYSPVPTEFGIDSIKAINATIQSYQCVVRPDYVLLDANITQITSKFRFEPKKCFLVLVNRIRREVWTQPANIHGNNIYGTWPNTTTWPMTHVAFFYVALADNHYISNFILID